MKPGSNQEKQRLIIKNMVCDRCITTTGEILSRLDIPFSRISLGEVEILENLPSDKVKPLKLELENVGFELILGKNEMMVNRIKGIIIQTIYENNFLATEIFLIYFLKNYITITAI